MSGLFVSDDILEEIGLGDLRDRIIQVVQHFRSLNVDSNEYVCLRYLVLMNPGKKKITSFKNITKLN